MPGIVHSRYLNGHQERLFTGAAYAVWTAKHETNVFLFLDIENAYAGMAARFLECLEDYVAFEPATCRVIQALYDAGDYRAACNKYVALAEESLDVDGVRCGGR